MKDWKILENIDFLSKVRGKLLQKLIVVIAALVNFQREEIGLSW
jgi:hypothetical protein